MTSVAVYDAVLGALTLRQVFSGEFDDQPTAIRGRFSGSPDASQIFGGQATPIARFQSADVGGVITGLSVTAGLAVSAGTIQIPFQKRANLGVFAAGSSHMRVNGTDGLVIPTQFSAAIGDEAATVALECWFQSTDGLTVPATGSTAQALAAQAFNAMWALGPVKINIGGGLVEIDDVASVTVTTGINVLPEFKNGTNYPYRHYINLRSPTIEVRFRDYDDVIANTYAALTAIEVYFRKRAAVGFVADTGVGNEQHIKLSFADGLVSGRRLSASGTDSGEATLMVEGETLAASAISLIA